MRVERSKGPAHRRWGGAAALMAAALAARPDVVTAQAGPPSVQASVVVSSTITPVSGEALSKTVTVFTRETLQQMGATTVTDALRLVPGVDAR